MFFPKKDLSDFEKRKLAEQRATKRLKGDTNKENKNYEIRKYPDRLVIETNSIQGNGFRKLFNYISGNNKENEEIKMTVPVTQENKNGNMTMQFYLPLKFNEDNAPKPINSEVKILTIEGGYYAVIKYSGRSSDQNFLKNKEILDKELKQYLDDPLKIKSDEETYLDVYKKVQNIYEKATQCVFVSHQDTIRSFTYYKLKEELFNSNKPEHCEIHEIIKNKLMIHTYPA